MSIFLSYTKLDFKTLQEFYRQFTKTKLNCQEKYEVPGLLTKSSKFHQI